MRVRYTQMNLILSESSITAQVNLDTNYFRSTIMAYDSYTLIKHLNENEFKKSCN